MTHWLVENWFMIVALIAVIALCHITVKKFVGLPTDEQINSVKKWLLYAVTEAEKELGVGTGKIKLRQVYDLFVTKFPWVAKTVSFEIFSMWVDESLIEMRKLISENANIKQYVTGSRF